MLGDEMKAYKVTICDSTIDIVEIECVFTDDLYEDGIFATYKDAYNAVRKYAEDLMCQYEQQRAKLGMKLQELAERGGLSYDTKGM